MHDYFFVLGRSFDLCKAEFDALVSKFKPQNEFETDSVVICSTNSEIPLSSLLETAAGVVKAGKVLDWMNADCSEEELLSKLTSILRAHFPETKKFAFGISLYGTKSHTFSLQNLHKQLKSSLSEQGASSEFVLPDGQELSSVQLEKYRLIGERGAEIVLIYSKDSLIIGLTKAVQPFEQWSKADFGRPFRDAKSGMLPPKVARMMIHAGMGAYYSIPRKTDAPIIFDPFCGSGTILTESLRIGVNTGGSDNSEKAVHDTQENVKWLLSSPLYTPEEDSESPFFPYNYDKITSEEIEVFQSDSAHIDKVLKPKSIDLIVAEAYLGPAFTEAPTPGKIDRIIKGLEKLYIGSLKSFHTILEEKGILVLAEPEYFMHGKSYKVGIIDNCERFGYTSIRQPILYKRDKALVGRRIGILRKK
ncbi:MAG: hypothetical protein M3Q44_01910 [bacterium]|nr:hypothetical protein [bacterium]